MSPSRSTTAHQREGLAARLESCHRERRAFPNLVAVDFFDLGDVVAVVDDLNKLGQP